MTNNKVASSSNGFPNDLADRLGQMMREVHPEDAVEPGSRSVEWQTLHLLHSALGQAASLAHLAWELRRAAEERAGNLNEIVAAYNANADRAEREREAVDGLNAIIGAVI